MDLQTNISTAVSDNSKYDQWSKKRGNKYTIGNIESGEVYVAGRGFNDGRINSDVRSVLLSIIKVVSVALFSYMMCDHILNIAVAHILRKIFGVAITVIPFNGYAILQDSTSYLFMIIMTIIKYVSVFVIFRMTFHMPTSLAHFKAPTLKEKSVVHSFGFTLVAMSFIASIYSALRIFSAGDYISSNLMNDSALFLENKSERWILLFLWSAIISSLVEVVVHSSAFAALRQFGDWFAILYMSVISSMILQNVAITPLAFITTFLTGITVVKTGSIYVGTVHRFIINLIMIVPFVIDISVPTNSFRKYMWLFTLTLLVVGILVLWASGFFKKSVMKKYFSFNKKNLFSGKEYVSVYFESLLSIIVFALCVILFIIGSMVSINGK